MASYADDIQFVLSEVARFARMDPREALKVPFPDCFATLPHPSGSGDLLCGAAAYRRLEELAKRALTRSEHAGRIDSEAVFKELQTIIIQRFINENRELDTQPAQRAVSAAIRSAAKAKANLKHFIPCHLGHTESPECFSIGPVSFHKRCEVFERLEPLLQEYREQHWALPSGSSKSADHRERREMLLTHVREYYDAFGWVAEVTIAGCDRPTSRRRAESIVQRALDCLQLLIGTAYSHHMRVGGPTFRTDRRGHIQNDADGNVELWGSVDWLGHGLGDGWWEMVNRDGGDHLVELMGIAIEAGHDLPRPAPLAQRFLDGAAWYGEAARDEFTASRLVKYVTAIERILTTKSEDKLVKILASRGAALLFDPDGRDLEAFRKRFRDAYNLRSRVIHGSRSPLEPIPAPGIRDAEKLARWVLHRALQFFRREGLEVREYSNQKLDKSFVRLVEWAESNPYSRDQE